mmetsp:Transcript_13789/g.24457  ORF Transcript_13789/g.24457 Transcript_13789/m.24457 type:complete len:277 (+) Transcript_13789:602-1432(+)
MFTPLSSWWPRNHHALQFVPFAAAGPLALYFPGSFVIATGLFTLPFHHVPHIHHPFSLVLRTKPAPALAVMVEEGDLGTTGHLTPRLHIVLPTESCHWVTVIVQDRLCSAPSMLTCPLLVHVGGLHHFQRLVFPREPIMLALLVHNIHHSLHLVLRTEPASLLTLKIEVRLNATRRMLALLFCHHVQHALQLVLGTEPAPLFALKVEGRLLAAPGMLAPLVLQIYHSNQLVLMTEPGLPLAVKVVGGPFHTLGVLAPLAAYIHHALQLVLTAKSAL